MWSYISEHYHDNHDFLPFFSEIWSSSNLFRVVIGSVSHFWFVFWFGAPTEKSAPLSQSERSFTPTQVQWPIIVPPILALGQGQNGHWISESSQIKILILDFLFPKISYWKFFKFLLLATKVGEENWWTMRFFFDRFRKMILIIITLWEGLFL